MAMEKPKIEFTALFLTRQQFPPPSPRETNNPHTRPSGPSTILMQLFRFSLQPGAQEPVGTLPPSSLLLGSLF